MHYLQIARQPFIVSTRWRDEKQLPIECRNFAIFCNSSVTLRSSVVLDELTEPSSVFCRQGSRFISTNQKQISHQPVPVKQKINAAKGVNALQWDFAARGQDPFKCQPPASGHYCGCHIYLVSMAEMFLKDNQPPVTSSPICLSLHRSIAGATATLPSLLIYVILTSSWCGVYWSPAICQQALGQATAIQQDGCLTALSSLQNNGC